MTSTLTAKEQPLSRIFSDDYVFSIPGYQRPYSWGTDQAQELLDEAIHVLAAIGARLAKGDSPYACIFAVLRAQSRVTPRVQTEAPVRDMDEAMEIFGAGADGVEPLLRPFSGDGAQTVRFYPRSPATH